MNRSTSIRFTLTINTTAIELRDREEPGYSCHWKMPRDERGIMAGCMGRILEEAILETTPAPGEIQAIIYTSGSFDYDAGVIDGLIAGMDIPIRYVAPQENQGEV